jgi:uncharacterized protein
MNFDEKVLSDSTHRSIGISKLEQNIINTRTFQRLKKIKHLGLASLVFPAAEHSRFVHSIGVMHVMSQMVDKLIENRCKYVMDNPDGTKQKLRLAALLHDIGHYPLAHLGEQVFKWVDEQRLAAQVTADSTTGDTNHNLLSEGAKKHESNAAGHERLGELILCSQGSELKTILEDADYDPKELARIINGEDKENLFYTQLMSSTLDCDRIDFLLRDSPATGTSYGLVDIDYIIRNLRWDEKNEYICFNPKAINAIEHFITGRYYAYNITYHKTVMGFELMAKVLFHEMIMDDNWNAGDYGGIVHSFKEIKDKIAADKEFLANFNDEYFWYYLELYRPADDLVMRLKKNILTRIPLRPIYEARSLDSQTDGVSCREYQFLIKNLISHPVFLECLGKQELSKENIAIVRNKIDFEEVPYSLKYDDTERNKPEHRLKLVKIMVDGVAKDLVDHPSSIIRILSNYTPCIARLYALVDKDSTEENKLKDCVRKLCLEYGA